MDYTDSDYVYKQLIVTVKVQQQYSDFVNKRE